MNSFENSNLHKDIKEALKRNNFENMTDIQHITIPELINNKDVIVKSQTGTGKTLAFVLPIIHSYLKNPSHYKKHIVSLIISPTRELALQITDVIKMFNVNVQCFIGGSDLEEDLKASKNDIKIIVGTPGRLYEIVKHMEDRMKRISYLILDEADRLIELGFRDKVLDLVKLLPKIRVTGLFSATINEDLKKLAKNILRNPKILESAGNELPDKLHIEYMEIRNKDKLNVLLTMFKEGLEDNMNEDNNMKSTFEQGLFTDTHKSKKFIVFFSTCSQVDFFYAILNKIGLDGVYKIHRKMKQEDRNAVYKNYYESGNILLCTDVAARGIDFKDINLVIHFDIPNDYNNIIHRSGRTARNGLDGKSLLFVMDNEKDYLSYLEIKKLEIKRIGTIEMKYTEVLADIKETMTEEILDLGVRAFVSYFRSYKEHRLTYILDYTTLNFDDLMELYMLKKIPGMAELKNVKFKNFPRIKNDEEGKKTDKPKKKHHKNKKRHK